MGYHVHQETSSADCDGPHYSSAVYVPGHELFEGEHDGLDIAMGWGMPWAFQYPTDGPVTVTISVEELEPGQDPEDPGAGRFVITYGRQTDEGHDSGELIICDGDDCEYGASVRDVFAERMGY